MMLTMWNINFKKYSSFLWVIIGINVFWIFFVVLSRILHWHDWPVTLPGILTAAFIQLVVQLVLVIDITKNKIYNKPFWIITILVMGPIGAIAYLGQRDKLMEAEVRT